MAEAGTVEDMENGVGGRESTGKVGKTRTDICVEIVPPRTKCYVI